jgi:hypothetical protein
MRKTTILYLAAGLVPAAAAVGPHLGELRGTLGLSAEWDADGDLYTSGGSALDDLGILGPDYAGETGTVEIRGASYSDAYDQPSVGVQAELSYGVSENVEIYAALGWTRSGGNTIQMGDLIPDSTGERLPLYASFEDLNTYSGEVGARYYFGQDNFRPFVGANMGAAYVEEIRLGLSAPDAGVLINDLAFYDATTVFSAGIEAGLAFSDGANLSGSVSVGAKYLTALDGNDTDLSSYGIGAIVEGSERIVVPVKGSLTLSF